MITQLYPVYSRPAVNFLDALAGTGAPLTPPFAGGPINNLYGLPPWGNRRYLIRAIEYLAEPAGGQFVGAPGLEFDFWGSAAGLTNVIATDTFISRYQFASVNGVQFNAVGLYRFYVDGLAIPYYDLDTASAIAPPTLHVAVQNVDIVPKAAGAAGAIACTFWVQPMELVQG